VLGRTVSILEEFVQCVCERHESAGGDGRADCFVDLAAAAEVDDGVAELVTATLTAAYKAIRRRSLHRRPCRHAFLSRLIERSGGCAK
jgi:hypothetical protein